MRAMMALVLQLVGVGKYVSQIWGQSVSSRESGVLQEASATDMVSNSVADNGGDISEPGEV